MEANRLTVDITQMTPEHLEEVAEVHTMSFDGFFLTFLGPKFLKLLYSEVMREPESVTLIALERDSQKVIGFIVGITEQDNFYKRLAMTRAPIFALASLTAVVRRPSIIPRLLRVFTYPQNKQKSATEALLMSLAVHPKAAANGIGHRLVSSFITQMQAQGVTQISLMTDKNNNAKANGFYRKLGFEVRQTIETPEGRWMYEYALDLADYCESIRSHPPNISKTTSDRNVFQS